MRKHHYQRRLLQHLVILLISLREKSKSEFLKLKYFFFVLYIFIHIFYRVYKPSFTTSSHAAITPQSSSSPEKRDVKIKTRILSRRYTLTSYYSKYFEIGVYISDTNPYIELVIGDNCGHEICFMIYAWKQMLQTKECISSLLKINMNEIKKINYNSLCVQGTIINNKHILKIFSNTTSIFITEETLNKLFNLELYIDYMY